MSEQVMVNSGTVADAVQDGLIRTIKKVKTSIANIRALSLLETKLNEEMKIYQDTVNTYILQNGSGKGQDTKLNLDDENIRREYLKFSLELRNTPTNIQKFSTPLFFLEDIEEKGVELTTQEAQIYCELGILEDIGLEIEPKTIEDLENALPQTEEQTA